MDQVTVRHVDIEHLEARFAGAPRALSPALDNLRDGPMLDSVFRFLDRRRARLTPYEQASFDFSTSRLHDDLAGTERAGRAMVRLAPKSPFAAYIWAIGERWSGHPRLADSIFATLDPDGGVMRGRIYLLEHHALALHALGAYDRELAISRKERPQYPNRLLPYEGEMRALAALGKAEDISALVPTLLTLQPDLGWTPAQLLAVTVFELRAHDHAAAADALSVRLLAWLASRPAPVASSPDGKSDRAEALIAAHKWTELQSLADSMVKEQPTSLLALRLQGVALGMRGHRDQARQIVSGIEHSGRKFYFGEDRRLRAFIAAVVSDKEMANALFEPTMAPLDDQHHTLVSELLRDYPPYQERMKPR